MKEKEGPGELLGLGGYAVMLVSGMVVSMVQVQVAGVLSALPAASIAVTLKVWLPSDKPE